MAARRRSKRKANWPDNLYETGGYFSWRNPVDGRHFGLGRIEFSDAAREARAANLHIAATSAAPTLVDRLSGQAERTVKAWAEEYKKLLAKRPHAETTKKLELYRLGVTVKMLGDDVIDRVDTKRIVEKLKIWTDAGKDRMAQAMRSFWLDFFKEAIADGWIPSRYNPVDITRNEQVAVKRKRLTWETFQPIYQSALAMKQPWVARSMELALVSAQRREDVAIAQFTQRDGATVFVHDGFLHVDQGKTGMRLRLPLSLRLKVLNLSLDDVVRRCRDDVVSRWLLHHGAPVGKTKPGDPVFLDTISKGFARARAASELTWAGQPPTFHELRSLAERLYKEQGNVNTQVLLGHKDPRSTRLYHDSRGAEWTELKVG